MKRVLFVLLLLTFIPLFSHALDIGKQRYVIESHNSYVILLDTDTGESWILTSEKKIEFWREMEKKKSMQDEKKNFTQETKEKNK